MAAVLHLDSSARQATSLSRTLSGDLVRSWMASHPDDVVRYRDLTQEPLPVVNDGWVSAAFSPPDTHDAALRFHLSRSDALVDELVAADLVVIGAPVYNFTVPAALKAWIDQIARVGRTFHYTETGPVGLLQGKRVIVVASSGSGPELLSAIGMEHHSSYLRGFFGFLGITDVEIVSVWGATPELAEPTVVAARARLAELAGSTAFVG